MDSLELRLKHWQTLTEEEKNALRDPRDYPILAVISGLSDDERKRIYRAIKFLDNKDYTSKQTPWISDFTFYLDENLKRTEQDHSPEEIKKRLLDEMINGAMHERFRLYYASKYRDKIEQPKDSEIIGFLSEVDEALRIYGQAN